MKYGLDYKPGGKISVKVLLVMLFGGYSFGIMSKAGK